ncbi:LAGLIDADG family homing endonuclease [Nanoarchaeota archaeon]
MQDNIHSIENFEKEKLKRFVIGLRAISNLSISELSYHTMISRDTIIDIENMKVTPKENTIYKLINYIKNNDLIIRDVLLFGRTNNHGYSKNITIPKLNLKLSSDFAELIGIILGDGEINKDGIRISFDPKKDVNFLERRVIHLIKTIFNGKIRYESYKRIAVYNIAFLRFLNEDCKLRKGSKFNNNTTIPGWCFNNQDYITSVLRGLFDTDGYFGYCNGSVEIMYGRFSDKCTNLVSDIEKALRILALEFSTQHTKDGRYKIRLTSKAEVLKFFSIVGSSNIKHITRFLLWRFAGYEAKIEKEGIQSLIESCNRLTNFKMENIDLPFLWNRDSFSHIDPYSGDSHVIKTLINVTKRL